MKSIVDTQNITPPKSEILDNLKELSVPHSVLSVIPYNIAVEYTVLPFNIDDSGRLEVAMEYLADFGKRFSLSSIKTTVHITGWVTGNLVLLHVNPEFCPVAIHQPSRW